MLFDLIIVSIVFAGNIFLGLFTLLKNPKSSTNQLFSLFSASIATYLYFNYFLYIQPTDTSSFFWVKMVMSIATFINLFFFLLTSTFPQKKFQLKTRYLILSTIYTIIVILLAQNNLVFTSAKAYGANGQPGIGMLFFLIHTLVFLGGGFFLLIKKFRKSTGIEKTQIKLFLLGAILMFTAILTTNLLFVLILHTGAFVKLLPLYTLVFLSFISYAIVRHRFLDIGLIVARSVAYLLILLLLGGVYTFYLLFVGSLIFKIPFSRIEFFFYGIIMFIVAFTFQPIKRELEWITDKFFYKGYYDAEKLLKSLSDIMGATIALKTLTTSILEKMVTEMRITRGVFVLVKKDDDNTIEYIEGVGYKNSPDFKTEDVILFLHYKKMIIFEDLEESMLKDAMRKLSISVVVPLIIHDDNKGILCLGEKASGEIYSQQDINVLEILAPQLSVAIQNAKEYEEIKRFNITLREEVDKATKDLQKANEQLKALDQLKDEFVSLASHELRTPMTAISSYIWMILDGEVGNINDKQKSYLQNTYTSTKRLIALVNDMLNVSRIESGRMILKQEPIDIEQIAQQTLTEVMPTAQIQGITVTIEKPANPLPKVMADGDKIKEVIMNLAGNSLKFTPSGGKITISFAEKDNLVETTVLDTGRGIKAEDIPKLFKKFGMIEGNYLKTTPGQGTGLGLYIAKSIVELHGGAISFHSDGENKGTTFSFTLKKA